jgi:polyribonucleotide nucleotidyltransferase
MPTAHIQWAGRDLIIETEEVARQADGAVLVKYGETVVLVTAVSSKEYKPGVDFLPLLVNYLEMTFAAGRIPGGFFKREGRPTDFEILNSRLVDRSIRPLFPKGYNYDTQVIATVLSVDQENDPSFLSIIGASAALDLSDIPFGGPVVGVKVGLIDGQFVINPTATELEKSLLDLTVAANREGIVMVEGGAKFVSEEVLLEAIFKGYEASKPVIEFLEELKEAWGKPKRSFTPLEVPEDLKMAVFEWGMPKLKEALQITAKIERRERISEILKEAYEVFGGLDPLKQVQIKMAFEEAERYLIRSSVLEEGKRIDGRALNEIRPISCEVGYLPRTHGSAVFRRGETQVLVTTTFGTSEDQQKIESLMEGETYKRFMVHYYFPPFCVGEIAPLRAPSRREIGHGALAERALEPVIPPKEEFPYTIRVVSQVLESNGSSSMATVCGGSLSLMDAGVPVRAAVAGIAMGLMIEGDKVAILTDIMGEEDHHGDMDFKVAGTREGVTSFQMDVKVPGVSKEILKQALEQAREARLYVLDVMNKTLDQPRKELSKYAPKIVTIQINPDKIRNVIGPLGKHIRSIIEKTGVKIDIEENGLVRIASSNPDAIQEAIKMVREYSAEAKIGETYVGTVKRIADFGAFIEIMPGVIGLCHISQLDTKRVKSVGDVVKVGQQVKVKVIEIDEYGRLRLSRKAVIEEEKKKAPQTFQRS